MKRTLPGFRFTLFITVGWLVLLVGIPLAGLFLRAASLPLRELVGILLDERTLSAFRVSFGTAAMAAAINAIFGPVVAWTLVRYRIPGHRILDALIDIPFALPTAVGSAKGMSINASRILCPGIR